MIRSLKMATYKKCEDEIERISEETESECDN